MAIEEPTYQVLQQDGAFEIRHYAPQLVAQTWVEGDMDAASNRGFRRIANFIFGNNQVPNSDQSATIAMTAERPARLAKSRSRLPVSLRTQAIAMMASGLAPNATTNFAPKPSP